MELYMQEYNNIVVWTDGSVNISNENKCSWAFMVEMNGEFLYDKSDLLYEENRTGNIAEMSAIINSLLWLDKMVQSSGIDPQTLNVEVYSDSQYCTKGINLWIKKWKLKNYQGVKNSEYWKKFYPLFYDHDFASLEIKWVKGHSGVPGNEHVDKMCGILTKKPKK
jgi:ribonuclease HI